MSTTLKFNPSFQSDDEAIGSFIVRRHEFEAIVEALTFSAESGRPGPQLLVVAPRGSGKTTLCRRVVAETRKSALREKWQSVFLSEESYSVTTPGEFFLECLFQLKDQLPGVPELRRAYEDAEKAQGEEELLQLSLGKLREFSQSAKKRLLIIVENFHTILNEQMQGGKATSAKILLDALNDSSTFAVLATTVTRVFDEGDAPLPAHFHRIELLPLSLGECSALWTSLTGVEVAEDKLRPLQILTGGSPRLLHILAEFMKTPSLHHLMSNLNYLIDQNTEYFKSQLDGLPSIERKVFATLLEIWDPSTAKQVAEAARVNTNTASAMLARLADRGAVIKEPGQGRTAIYYAAERLFNIYYLMRRRSHPSSRVRALVSFMMEYYDGDELVDTTAILVREACGLEPSLRGDYHTTFDAIMSHSPDVIRDRILARTPTSFIQSFRDDQRAYREQAAYLPQHPSRLAIADSDKDLIERIEEEADKGNLPGARVLISEGLRTSPELTELWIRLCFVEMEIGEVSAAIEAGLKARELKPQDPWSHTALGMALSKAGRKAEAEDSYLAAVAIDPGHAAALTAISASREARGEAETVLPLFESARNAGLLNDMTQAWYGNLLARLEHWQAAEELLRDGADVAENNLRRHGLVEFLEKLGRQEEGVQLLRSVAESDGRWEVWADYGSYLLARTNDAESARFGLRKAIDLGADNPVIFLRLARAILESDGAEEDLAALASELIEAHTDDVRAWLIAGQIYEDAGDDRAAELSYRSALERPDGAIAAVPLARLLQKYVERRSEAEELLRTALNTMTGKRRCVPSRELAELLIHDGDDVQAAEILDAALLLNNRCDCCMVLRGDISCRRGDVSEAEKNYRAALEIDPTDIAALTGLAPIVSVSEADRLIRLAVEADSSDPRVLLAGAKLHTTDVQAQRKGAEAALSLDPRFVEGRLFLVHLETREGAIDAAIAQLESALSDLSGRRELIPGFVEAAMNLSESDASQQTYDALAAHPNRLTIEPLIVALQMKRGEAPMVAKEIRDVAWDIIVRHSNKVASEEVQA